jgi:choline dehydrogenase-like flavoprotein
MYWLSKSVESLIAEELTRNNNVVIHDVVVVGSGYGGAVSALRLTEKGHEVLVLERGEEYLPGEFPNDIANLPRHLRVERWNQKQPAGYDSSLFDLRVGERAGVLVGNALGGTSQINANAALRPDPRVFDNGRWPEALVTDAGARKLDQYFERAEETLEVDPDGVTWPEKNRALQRLADGLGGKFQYVPITVANHACSTGMNASGVPTEPCIGCGDCVTGCNYFAKNTLTTTYLAQARAEGAKLYTGVTVLKVSRESDKDPWDITIVRTTDRAAHRRSEKNKQSRDKLTHRLRAWTVILSAGTLGSTEILARSREEGQLAVSQKTLGSRFSGNGDYLAFAYLGPDRVNGVGEGSRGPAADGADRVGPTISGLIRVDDPSDVKKSTMIQEGAIPGALAGIFHELTTTIAAVSQLTAKSYRGEAETNPPVDPLVLQSRGLTHSQALLAMGHDRACGTLCYDATADRLRIEWPSCPEDQELYKLHDERLRHVERARADGRPGAIYLANPAWRPLPESVGNVLTGPKLGNGMFTVHPLGGCPMGEDFESGVVNDVGAVYCLGGETHPGLYVLDGSIVPCALGVNPLLTITALAERAMGTVAGQVEKRLKEVKEGEGKGTGTGEPGQREKPGPLPEFPCETLRNTPYANVNGDRMALHFTEVLRGEITQDLAICDRQPGRRYASLILHMPIVDLKRFFEVPSHPIAILGATGEDKERLTARLSIGDLVDDRKRTAGPGAPAPEKQLDLDVVSGTALIFQRHAPRGLSWLDAMVRVVLTWFIERGKDELLRWLTGRGGNFSGSVVLDSLKLANHATESRGFNYLINLRALGRSYVLRGRKNFSYAASWAALRDYFCKWLSGTPLRELYLQRRNVWTSLGQLDVELYDEDGERLASGSLEMDMVEMTRRHAAQLGSLRDSATALLTFASYPLLFARALIKTRLWDFRLPDYPPYDPPHDPPRGRQCDQPRDKPREQPRTETVFPPLRKEGDERPFPIAPEYHPLEFPELPGAADGNGLLLRLTRYPRRKAPDDKSPPEYDLTASGATQVKSILLVNGFAQSTLPFVAQEMEQNLAEYFYDLGYDVWLFDYRTSPLLEASRLPCTMDDIARHDIPHAVDHILKELAAELKMDAKLQIYSFSHCVGAAVMAMSMLAGRLQHSESVSKIAGVIFSQMQAFLIGGETSQMRLPVASLLRDVAGIKVLRLSTAEGPPTVFESLLDRLFATLPLPDDERCPHENDRVEPRPDIATCKRMTGVISRVLKHDRISKETHERLSMYFGRANTELLVHGTKCIEYERLVNADGQNVYVIDQNIRRYFTLPIALLHGRENALFSVESCQRTYDQLVRVNGRDFADTHYRMIIADGYAHFDCTVGIDAERCIFPKLGEFLECAWIRNQQLPPAPPNQDTWTGWRSRAQAPVTGPLLSVRDTSGERRIRLWMQVNEYEADRALCAITLRRAPDGSDVVEAWPILRMALAPGGAAVQGGGPGQGQLGGAYVAIAIAEFDPASIASGPIDMVSVHAFPHADRRVAGGPCKTTIPDPLDVGDNPRSFPKDFPGVLGVDWRPEAQNASQRGAAAPQVLGTQTRAPEAARLQEAGDSAKAPALHCTAKQDAQTWIEQRLKNGLPQSVAVHPTIKVSPAEAHRLLATLRHTVAQARKTAQRANPRTLSRKRRALPEDGEWTAQLIERVRTGPSPANSLRFLASCCRYPGLEFEANRADAAFCRINQLLENDAGHRDFMLLVGDQIYADATAGVFDTASPIEKFRLRYEQAFGTREFRRLARQLPLYMTIDDHEIDDGWSTDRLCEGDAARRLFYTATSSFAAYQWSHSPRNIQAPGFNYQFDAGDHHFLVLDTRTQRSRLSNPPTILDAQQLSQLKAWLARCKADPSGERRPKFIVTGSVLVPGFWRSNLPQSDLRSDNWQMALAQRRIVLDLIRISGVSNVVFISGDYHCSATATLDFDNGVRAYAIVTPPLYAPFPYANAPAHAVMDEEEIELGTGSVQVVADVQDGNGFMDLRVDHRPQGDWSLEITNYHLRFEDRYPGFTPVATRFDLVERDVR